MRIDIWSDIACPWCYIGKRRFEAGAEAFRARRPDVALTVEHHSFELAPDTPVDFAGGEIEFLVAHKGMPEDQVRQMLGQMTELGATDGIDFAFDAVQHVNTRRTHRVLHLARERGVQSAVLDRLFRAYFSEGENLADEETLARLGAEAGLDSGDVMRALEDETYGEAVEKDLRRAQGLGISGVPFFLFAEKYAVSGAQPVDVFRDLLEQVHTKETEEPA